MCFDQCAITRAGKGEVQIGKVTPEKLFRIHIKSRMLRLCAHQNLIDNLQVDLVWMIGR
jgi:hypothetical protein